MGLTENPDLIRSVLWTFLLLSGLTRAEDDKCSLPKDAGRCRAMKPGYFYFNDHEKRCESFFYSGCGGNKNQFRSLQECHDTCQHRMDEDKRIPLSHIKSDHCLLGPIHADQKFACMAFFPRYTFNAKTLRCEKYSYGGCGETQNLYKTLTECMSSCLYGDVPSRGGSRVREMLRGRAKAEMETGSVIFPGSDPEDICNLPPVTPSKFACMAFAQMWTYDARQGECVPYVYGGCNKTPNLFNSKEDCQAKCPKKLKDANEWTRPEFCTLPPIKDSQFVCEAFMPRFTFDAEENKCVSYVYGGCLGTKNLFHTLNECQSICDLPNMKTPKTLDVCGLPVVAGLCKAQKPRFGYNKDKKRCEMFLYGGCGGNGNRFSSVQDCVNTCGGSDPETNPVCSMIDCDQQMADFYRAKGCQPIINAGECCPSSWDCTIWDERVMRKDECFVANSKFPMGKFYKQDEAMPELDDGCTMGCFCATSGLDEKWASPTCAAVDCMFSQPPPNAVKCRPIYHDQNQCCSQGLVCDDELESLSQCVIGNKTYSHGQLVDIQSDPCMRCLCKDGFSEDKIGSDEFCHRTDCFSAYSSEKLLQGCRPVFQTGVCCPNDWICPRHLDSVELSRNGQSFEEHEEQQQKDEDEDYNVVSGSEVQVKSPACMLPVVTGSCKSRMKRFHYNRETGICQQFEYTGCQGNENNFKDMRTCIQTCVTKDKLPSALASQTSEPRTTEPCEQVRETGPCKAKRPAFFFDKDSKTCQIFFYGGCKGNDNRFGTFQECSNTCHVDMEAQKAIKEKCNLPKDEGEGRTSKRRWFFNADTNKCQQFIYFGALGNANNFQSHDECLTSCLLSSNELDDPNSSPGEGRSLSSSSTIGGNGLPLPDIQDPEDEKLMKANQMENQLFASDPCLLDREVGLCRAAIPRYNFDRETKQCIKFSFGGCQGNANNFVTKEDCVSKCQKHMIDGGPTVTVELSGRDGINPKCNQPMDVGSCRALKPRFFYNHRRAKCEEFFWGGCGGNQNRFSTKQECLEQCHKEPEDPSDEFSERGLFSGDRPFHPIVFPTPDPTCQSNNETYNVGDEIRFADKKCQICTCSTPPELTCVEKKCPTIAFVEPEGLSCRAVRDEDDCCQVGLECVSRSPPSIGPEKTCALKPCPALGLLKPEGAHCTKKFDPSGCCHIGYDCSDDDKSMDGDLTIINLDDLPREERCKHRACTLLGYLPQPGMKCVHKFDADGCCQIGVDCVPEVTPSVENVDLARQERCKSRMCNLRGYLPKPGHKCTPQMDEDGCCQIGLNCIPEEAPAIDRTEALDISREERCKSQRCLLTGFRPKPGHTCTPQYDKDGCCQTGLECIPDQDTEILENRRERCKGKRCTLRGFLSKPDMICTPKFDDDGCCQIGLDCVSKESPSIRQCALSDCESIDIEPPPNSQCEVILSPDGCCSIGLQCVPDEAPFVEPPLTVNLKCANKICNLMGFLPPREGGVCKKVMDADGCCQVGLDCDSAN